MSCQEALSLSALFASNKKDSSAKKNQDYAENVEEIEEHSPLKEENINHEQDNKDVSPFNAEKAEFEQIDISQAKKEPKEEPRIEEVVSQSSSNESKNDAALNEARNSEQFPNKNGNKVFPSKRTPYRIVLMVGLTVIGALVIGLTIGLIVSSSRKTQYDVGPTRVQSSSKSNFQSIETRGVTQIDPNLFLGSEQTPLITHSVGPSRRIGARLLQEVARVLNRFGTVDYVNKEMGIVIRFITPTNIELYVILENLLAWIKDHYPQEYAAISVEEIKKYLKILQSLLEKVEEVEVKVTEQIVWQGEYDPKTKLYSIETQAETGAQNGDSTKKSGSNLNSDQGSHDIENVLNPLKNFVETKARSIKKHANKIMESLGFRFDDLTDLFTKEIKIDNPEERKKEQKSKRQSEEGSRDEQMSFQMMTGEQLDPLEPIKEETVKNPVLAKRPEILQNQVVITKETYDSLINCVDLDMETKVCTVPEWKKEGCPFERTEGSVAREEKNRVFRWIRVSIQH